MPTVYPPYELRRTRGPLEQLLERVNVKDFGAVGDWDGVNGSDDTIPIQRAINAVSTSVDVSAGLRVVLPRGRYRITDTITVPPGVILEGEAIHNGDNLTPASIVDVQFDGVGVRFVRRNAAGLLTFNGGARHLVFSGLGDLGPNQKLVELGDSTAVNTLNGAWHGQIEHCAFNYTYGYGIYSAHSQEWLINHNYFRGVAFPVFYATVAASAKITNNSIDNSGLAPDSYGIVLYNGTLGGAAGALISGNYCISCTVGVWLANQIGAVVRDNVFEGVRNDSIHMDKYRLDGATLDNSLGAGWTDGCNCCQIVGNTFINYNADGAGSHSAIKINNSRRGYIGHNAYVSPNAAAGPAIGVYDGGVDTVDDWIIVEPVVTGINSGLVRPYPAANGVWQRQTVICRDGFKLSTTLKDALDSSDKGRLWLDANSNLAVFDGASTRTPIPAVGAVVGTVGASAGYVPVNIGGTTYKVQVYNP